VGRHNALHAVVFSSPECDREEDATARNDGARTHTQKWVRRGEPRHGDLRLLESCETDEVEGRPTINQDVVHTDVGDGRGDDQRELLGAPMFLGQLEASNAVDVSIHLWWGTTLGVGAAAATARCSVLMMRLDVMS
jgi:hypothetical protein